MKTCDEIRREKLTELKNEFGGVAELANTIGKSETQIRQWINASKDSKTGKPRGISDDIARHIEGACKKPRGWMDNPNPSRKDTPGDNEDLPSSESMQSHTKEVVRLELLEKLMLAVRHAKAEDLDILNSTAESVIAHIRRARVIAHKR